MLSHGPRSSHSQVDAYGVHAFERIQEKEGNSLYGRMFQGFIMHPTSSAGRLVMLVGLARRLRPPGVGFGLRACGGICGVEHHVSGCMGCELRTCEGNFLSHHTGMARLGSSLIIVVVRRRRSPSDMGWQGEGNGCYGLWNRRVL